MGRRWPFRCDMRDPIWKGKARDMGKFEDGDTLRIVLHHYGRGVALSLKTDDGRTDGDGDDEGASVRDGGSFRSAMPLQPPNF